MQILEEPQGENGLIVFAEFENPIQVVRKREFISELWWGQNAFGLGKHAQWWHSVDHPSKPVQLGKYMPVRSIYFPCFTCVESNGEGCKITEYIHCNWNGKESEGETRKLQQIFAQVFYNTYAEAFFKLKTGKLKL